MSGAPETTYKQNTNPERDEAREILVEHPAPSSDMHGMGSKDTCVISSCPVVAAC